MNKPNVRGISAIVAAEQGAPLFVFNLQRGWVRADDPASLERAKRAGRGVWVYGAAASREWARRDQRARRILGEPRVRAAIREAGMAAIAVIATVRNVDPAGLLAHARDRGLIPAA